MDEKYALSIGVRKSGVLPALDGAISDAHAFANWARDPKQKYNVTLITDEQWQPVTIDRLKTASPVQTPGSPLMKSESR
jgi:hypothetical protein